MRQVQPYGTWASPLTAARVTAGSLRLDHIVIDGTAVYWVEGRASENGRYVIVRRTVDGQITDITPPGFNVRSRVHEYGGAAFTVHQGTVYFSNFSDQRLYRQSPGAAPAPLTPPGYFYADGRVDALRGRLICVREDHTAGDAEPVNTIVAVDIAGGSGAPHPEGEPSVSLTGNKVSLYTSGVLVEGADFYSDPILSPDGKHLAWLQWNHPNMPWDGTELWVATVRADGGLEPPMLIAGGVNQSVFQPEWSPDGRLYFISDLTGFWNLYRTGAQGAQGAEGAHFAQGARGAIEPIYPMAADFGKPQWTFSTCSYAFISASQLAVTYSDRGRWRMALIEPDRRQFHPLPFEFEPTEVVRATTDAVYFIGGSPLDTLAVVRVGLDRTRLEIIRSASSDRIDPSLISVPEAVTFTSNGADVHAFYYAPTNPDCVAPPEDRPPLLVLSHGGPTSATTDVLDPRIQFWTARGFAVLDVNYGGSSGYGRAYRDRLKGQWGIVDVADCVNGALALAAAGKADPARLIIRGGSAGGYTTLAALTFHDVFKAGASYYGISDIEILARDTHKFESRYLDSLIGPYPEARELYRQRSPIHFTDRLSCSLILFQGLEDKVVPPNQSEMMADAVRRKGLPVAYVPFAGEQHGFRKEENIIRSLEAELFFYGAVFKFGIADDVAPVAIDNLQ
jgi:acetyl esterase/lipase